MKKEIVIGSRGSDLALWQANFVRQELEKLGCSVAIKIIKTQGDQIQHLSFDKMEGKGFFTKEIETALLNKEIDLAIHSYKDLETEGVKGLQITATSYREDPSDVLIIRKDAVDLTQTLGLKTGAITGTSSARRKSQLRGFRSDLNIKDLRGNVPTRIDKLRNGEYDAIMLAQAGINRLQIDLSEFHVNTLDPKYFIPAPAQGVLGLQTRTDDRETNEVVKTLDHPKVRKCIEVERKVLNLFAGGCQLPLGVYCAENEDSFSVWGALGKEDNQISRIQLDFKDTSIIAPQVVEALKKKVLT